MSIRPNSFFPGLSPQAAPGASGSSSTPDRSDYGSSRTSPSGSTSAFSQLSSYNPTITVADPMRDPTFARRRLSAMTGVTRGADSAGREFMRSTGLGSGTGGGSAQKSLLRLVGAGQAQMVGDEMYDTERKYLTGIDEGNATRQMGLFAQLAQLEAARNQLLQNQWQFENQLGEGQYQFDVLNPAFSPDETFVPTSPGRPKNDMITLGGYRL